MKFSLLFILLILSQLSVLARPEYLNKYEQDPRSLPSNRGKCSVCHVSSAGGGPRNKFGQAFESAGFMITNALVEQFPNLFKQNTSTSSSGAITNSSSGSITAPIIKRIKPTVFKSNLESVLKIKGNGFTNESMVLIDNNEASTTFKSSVQLIVNFILNTVGVHEVKVKNSDGQESNSVTIKAK